ncbi:MAG: hypothetical protein RLZZ32_660 [Cyanobacteriota bacterium]|jgi:MtN3 and saliva related transmembrane protein
MHPAWPSGTLTVGSRWSLRRHARLICHPMSVHPPAIAALGYVAACFTTLSFIPQAIKTLRSGDTRGISLRMYALFTMGIALWGIYGLCTGDGPLIVANAITLVACSLILDRKWRAWWRERSGP